MLAENGWRWREYCLKLHGPFGFFERMLLATDAINHGIDGIDIIKRRPANVYSRKTLGTGPILNIFYCYSKHITALVI